MTQYYTMNKGHIQLKELPNLNDCDHKLVIFQFFAHVKCFHEQQNI